MPAPPPTARLLRAVAAERDELDRHHARMTEEADELRRALLASSEASRRSATPRPRPLTASDAGVRGGTRGACGDAGCDALATRGAWRRGTWRRGVRATRGVRGDARGTRGGDAGVRRRARGDAEVRGDARGTWRRRGARSDAEVRGDAERGDAGACAAARWRRRACERGTRRERRTWAGCSRAEIRAAAVRVLLERGGEAMHYRGLVRAGRGAGLVVAGKDPLAVFLTQLGRSPAGASRSRGRRV
jgi:hypothetical protein